MLIWVFSDLHLDVNRLLSDEALPARDSWPEHDVIVIAGDIMEGVKESLRWIEGQEFEKPVIYVPGNHEFYGRDLDRELEAALEAQPKGVSMLHNSAVDIGNVTFLGGTMWTDYKLYGEGLADRARAAAASSLNDHRLIRCSREPIKDGLWKPHHAAANCAATQSYIYAHSRSLKAKGRNIVAVTHHAPSARSIPPRFAGRDLLNAAYVSAFDRALKFVDVWIHGHTHQRVDYIVGECRVVCNPMGYVRHNEYTGYDPSLVVALGERSP